MLLLSTYRRLMRSEIQNVDRTRQKLPNSSEAPELACTRPTNSSELASLGKRKKPWLVAAPSYTPNQGEAPEQLVTSAEDRVDEAFDTNPNMSTSRR